MSEALKLDSPKKAETKILNAQIFLHCRFFLFLSFHVPSVSVCVSLFLVLSRTVYRLRLFSLFILSLNGKLAVKYMFSANLQVNKTSCVIFHSRYLLESGSRSPLNHTHTHTQSIVPFPWLRNRAKTFLILFSSFTHLFQRVCCTANMRNGEQTKIRRKFFSLVQRGRCRFWMSFSNGINDNPIANYKLQPAINEMNVFSFWNLFWLFFCIFHFAHTWQVKISIYNVE